jgi:putative ABC transport system permease protein
VTQLPARIRSLWRSLARARQLDAEMDEEMRFHVEAHAERLMRDGRLDASEARRRAYVAFGGVEKYKEEGRDTRGLRWVDAISLDMRLGMRMLMKHRGLTMVGGFAMAVAIAIGATGFEMFSQLLGGTLPFEGGDRVVALQYVSGGSGNPQRRVLHEYALLRDELEAVEQLGAFRTVQHNLVVPNAPPEPIKVAEISAAGFTIARTPPLLGRYLLSTDERPDASPVIVIGQQVWQSRFSGDPNIVGRVIGLGETSHVIIGVMPDGFHFPVDHQFWIPLRQNPLQYERLQGPEISIFGRLAPGVTLEQAQAELTSIGQSTAAAHAETHERLRPIVLPYTHEHLDINDPTLLWMFRIAQLLVGALTFVVAVNLAILFYARTITRLGEIAVRTALGASRRRILAQLFIEALALSSLGALAGLALADVALAQMQDLARANGSVPYWMQFQLSASTGVYALGLAVLAAVIMGVLPGVKATGRDLTVNLHEASDRSGTRLGPMWTMLVIGQVSAAVAVLPIAVYLAWHVVQLEVAGSGFADDRFVVGTLASNDRDAEVDRARLRDRQRELMSRLEMESGVTAVTFSSSVPGFAFGRSVELEDGVLAGDARVLDVSSVDVAIDLFDVYEAQTLAGRSFNAGDVGSANVVVVNQSFADALLNRHQVLGMRFRYSPNRAPRADDVDAPWYQIIGVVRDFPDFPDALSLDTKPVVFHPAAAGDIHPVVLSVRFASSIPDGVVNRFRVLAAEVDPALQLRRVVPLSTFYRDVRSFWRYIAWAAGLLTASVLLLSAAGIYALMSFTVAQRTREIGIRTALGAHPRRIVLSVFGRSLQQLGMGVLAGSVLSSAVFSALGLSVGPAAALLLSVAGIMSIVGLLAAFGPARRGLRTPTTDALRS